jgi:hypothetical protein
LLQKKHVENLLQGTVSRKTSESTDKFNGQNPLNVAMTNALEFLRGQNFENWPRGDPRATGHTKYEQKYGQNEPLARATKAPDGPNRSPGWPRGLSRQFGFPAGRVGGFGGHGCTGGATGAGFGLLYFDWRTCALRSWPPGAVPEAHAGIVFAKPDFGYNEQNDRR